MFQISTTEGWLDIMSYGVDSVGIDLQPIYNNNVYWSLFFIMFVGLANFLILNLFVGVVVNAFN